ncbi:MAG: shikimate dehydrogenase, partial [bacterium]
MSADVTGKTEIVGIYGCPIEHTLSPRMHNAALRALGLDMIYLPFEVKSAALREAVEAIRALNFVGVNLTHPHKRAVIEHLDDMSDEAREIGAVNTIVNRNGTLVGHNTDGAGFMRSLSEDYGFSARGRRVVIFGAGGAGRAIGWALSHEPPKRLVIVNRTFDKAESLAAKVGGCALPWDDPELREEISTAHLLINATSTSLDLDHNWVPEKLFIYDIVYDHKNSLFIQGVQGKGARIGNGLSMLLHQGALAFELWTGQKAPLEVMRRALGLRG